MKNVIFVLALALALVATPALAYSGGHHSSGGDIEVENENHAVVGNMVIGNSNTGANMASGGSITTGTAYTGVGVLNQVNYNETTVRTFGSSADIEVENENSAFVGNLVVGNSNTGRNMVSATPSCHHHCSSAPAGSIRTGATGTEIGVENLVNTNVTTVRTVSFSRR